MVTQFAGQINDTSCSLFATRCSVECGSEDVIIQFPSNQEKLEF
jgi:hypothetical protein